MERGDGLRKNSEQMSMPDYASSLVTRDIESPTPDVVRFSLKSLFLLTFLCSVALALVAQLRLLGTEILFLTAVVASFVLLNQIEKGNTRIWLHAMWGIILPLACLATDPFLFVSSQNIRTLGELRLSPFAVACYGFMGWQMIMLFVSWLLTSSYPMRAAIVSGSLLAGSIFAGTVALVLTPITVIAMIFVVGLPGITPWLTMVVYLQAARTCWGMARRTMRKSICVALGLVGFVSSLVAAVCAVFAWIEIGGWNP